jgi:hypothetical protein
VGSLTQGLCPAIVEQATRARAQLRGRDAGELFQILISMAPESTTGATFRDETEIIEAPVKPRGLTARHPNTFIAPFGGPTRAFRGCLAAKVEAVGSATVGLD